MPEYINSEPACYQSQFLHGVDLKRRTQVPAKWCPTEPEAELTLIPWPKRGLAQESLLVLPPSRMRLLSEKLRAMPLGEPKAEALRRLIGSKSAGVTVDKSGRILIPDTLAKWAGIEKEALFVGMVDCFAIWSPDRYKAVETGDEVLTDEALKMI